MDRDKGRAVHVGFQSLLDSIANLVGVGHTSIAWNNGNEFIFVQISGVGVAPRRQDRGGLACAPQGGCQSFARTIRWRRLI